VRGLNLNPFQSSEFLGNSGGDTPVATYIEGEVPLYVDLTPRTSSASRSCSACRVRCRRWHSQARDSLHAAQASTSTTRPSQCARHALGQRERQHGWRGGAIAQRARRDNLAVRASIDRYDDPGFIDTPYLVRQAGISDPEPNFADPAAVAANLYRIDDADWENTNSARVALRWQTCDFVDATFTYHYQNMEVGGRSQNHSTSFGTGLYESGTRFAEPNERHELLSAEVVADLGFAELTPGHRLLEVRGARTAIKPTC
jgi:hypothetical protein